MKKKNIYNLLLYAGIFAGAVLITLTYCLLQGSLGALRNDSTFYIEQAKGILSNGLFYYGAHISTPYYWGYPTFLAICMAFVGENWVAIAIIQILLSACSTVFLFFILYTLRYTQYASVYTIFCDRLSKGGILCSSSSGTGPVL